MLIVFDACKQFKSSKSGATSELVCRYARFRSPWPLLPRQPMAVVLRAGRDVIVDPRLGPRPLRGPGGGPQTAWAALPKSIWGNWASQRTARAAHARRRKGRWPIHVAKTTSAESQSKPSTGGAPRQNSGCGRASAGKRLPGRASRVRCGRLVGHRRREIFCPAHRLLLSRVENDSGAALGREPADPPLGGCARAAPAG